MSGSVVLGATAVAAADALQGGYFRTMLLAERDAASAELVTSRSELDRWNAADESGLERIRDDVAGKERHLAQVDALITALEERFASHW